MTFSMQSRHGLAYGIEPSFGQPPATPPLLQALRHTACDLALDRAFIHSDEIRADRLPGPILPGRDGVRGEIGFELSFGDFDPLLAAVLFSQWDGDSLTIGEQRTSFLFQRAFHDIGMFQQFGGCVLDGMTLSVQPESIVSGHFSVVGRHMLLTETSLSADEPPAASSAWAPFDSFRGTVHTDGVPLALAAGLDLTIRNGAEQAYVLGGGQPADITAGRTEISGELTAFFEDHSLLERFMAGTPGSLGLTLAGPGGGYELELPQILYTGAALPVRGDRLVLVTLPFRAVADAAGGGGITITRNAA
jgi:hypothetical protein